MAEVIRLREWERSGPLRLSQESLQTLASLGHRMEVRPAGRGRWTLRPKGIVGRIGLREAMLELCSKHPVDNLCRMIFTVSGVLHLLDTTTPLGDGSLPDLLTAAFVERTEALLSGGLRRDYVERRESLRVLRGRLDLSAHLRRPEALVADLSCHHEDYTLATPFNAVLRQTAEVCHSQSAELAGRLMRLRHRLAGLPNARLAPEAIDGFRYDRLTEAYRPVHAVCRWILAGTRLGLGRHQIPGSSFVVDMAPLFEKFVELSLRAELEPGYRVKGQDKRALDRAGSLMIKPDVVVSRGDRTVAVLDAKYKLRRSGRPANDDAYQVLAYAMRYDVRRVWLVYPDEAALDRVLVVRNADVEVVCRGLDLGRSWGEVQGTLKRLATYVRESDRRSPPRKSSATSSSLAPGDANHGKPRPVTL